VHISSLRRIRALFPLVTAVLLAGIASRTIGAAEEANSAAVTEHRLFESVRYLASDELEGRGVGTRGLDRAADYLAAQFSELGLKTQLVDGGPFQKFKVTTSAELGKQNHLALVGPDGKQAGWKLGDDFDPLAIGGSATLDLPLVFVGYGITDKDNHYDDYQGVSVEGKAVIVLRHEPQQDNPHSIFNGTQNSPFAPFSRKLSNAYEHGAAAVIFVTDDYDIQHRVEQRRKVWQQALGELTEAQAAFPKIEHPTLEQTEAHRKLVEPLLTKIHEQGEKLRAEYDPLLGFTGAGSGGDGARLPAVNCRRAVLNAMFRSALNTDLAALEHEIDQGPKPRSREISGYRLVGRVSVERHEAEVKNVIAVLEGEGATADETIVIGAHYDHLGWGGDGSFVPDKREIHNGADDNASGAAALVEVARELTRREHKLPRRIVLIAFTGEERGLLGSAYYCRHPLFPLERTVAMLNMDMVGRLQDDKLIVQGVDTATEFGPIIDRLNERAGFKITRQPGGFGPSDHASFYGQKIPVMHFFTGVHKDYHRPTDDYDKINATGMRRVAEFVAETAVALAEAPGRPTYKETKPPAMLGGGSRPYFGSIPDFSNPEPGYSISGVAQGGPADKGGLKAGDTIIRLGDSRIGNLEDFDSALRKHKGGDKVGVVVKRAGQEVTLSVTLDAPR
jgi:peptidase M28-like protein/PDZ domain-containing protein